MANSSRGPKKEKLVAAEAAGQTGARGWCAGVVPTAPRSLKGIRREMRQAESPARGEAVRATCTLPELIYIGVCVLCHGDKTKVKAFRS